MSTPDTINASPAIELKGVEVRSMNSPDKTVLDNVDWIIQAGEIWLVAGLQGTGKSDLLSMLAGLTQPLSGDYRLFGQDMAQDESTRRGTLGRVSSVFEHAGLLHQLSVRENVILPLQYHSEFSEEELENRLQWLLNFADISSISDSYPRRLSVPGAAGQLSPAQCPPCRI